MAHLHSIAKNKSDTFSYVGNSVVMYTYTYGGESEMDMWVSDNQASTHEKGGKFK